MTKDQKAIRAKIKQYRPKWLQVLKSPAIDKVQTRDFTKDVAEIEAMPGYDQNTVNQIMSSIAQSK